MSSSSFLWWLPTRSNSIAPPIRVCCQFAAGACDVKLAHLVKSWSWLLRNDTSITDTVSKLCVRCPGLNPFSLHPKSPTPNPPQTPTQYTLAPTEHTAVIPVIPVSPKPHALNPGQNLQTLCLIVGFRGGEREMLGFRVQVEKRVEELTTSQGFRSRA